MKWADDPCVEQFKNHHGCAGERDSRIQHAWSLVGSRRRGTLGGLAMLLFL